MSTDDAGTPENFQMTIWIKGDMVKVAISATRDRPGSTVISRRDLGIMWVLDESAKTYFEVRHVEEQSTPPSVVQSPSMKRTGKTRKILGYGAEQILMTSGEAETEIWGTKDLKHLSVALSHALDGEGVSSGGGWNSQLSGLGLFPLISKTRLGSRVLESSEVIRITPQKLGEEAFAIPAGFTRQGVNDMVR